MTNKTKLIILGGIIVVIALASSYLLSSKKSSPQSHTVSTREDSMSVETLSAEEIGLELATSPDKKKIQFTINRLTEVTSVSYDLTYEADATAAEIAEGSEDRVQRGITGEEKFKKGDKSFSSQWIVLGSSSGNVYKYDLGVDSITMILKITKTDNKIYQVEKTFKI